MAKIMIADDHKDIVDTLKMAMEKMGHNTAVAYNGGEVLGNIDNVKPDLLLLDVMMPGITTKEVLTQLNKKGYQNLKIIFVTVVRFSDEEKRTLMHGSNIVDYITKPFGIKDLMERVKKALG